ncbi:trimethylamine methyltransferase [Desulfoluna butyratoxydans]|uniref:Trimethylamine methyltransferase n=2 Tax=Desulfoluna butyratoxydans TaxID=231438 RepID=A0A4U8YTY1_9BACT|nr:trimethylamine methyltransferase [Desulfoluna butyratoxydans]
MGIEMKRQIDVTFLGPEKVAKIHEASLTLLETVGMRVGGERGIRVLRDAGCEVDADGMVKIPRALVEEALETVPKELVLYNRAGEKAMVINAENAVHFGTHADQLEFVDPDTGKVRPFLKADTKTMCTLADALPNIDFILSVGMSKDVAPEIQTQISFIETVKHFSKTINFSTNDIDSLQEVIDIAAVVAGGKEALAEKPFIFNYCEPIPPLSHPEESTEKLIISALNRIPVVYMPYCMMGGTAPMSFSGALVQCNAEALGGLVVHQRTCPGAPFIYGAMPSIMDMISSIGSYGAVEFHLMVAAASELVSHYGLPFYGTAGCTDAKGLDIQAVSEVTQEIFSTLLSKANLVHDVGVSDHCNSVNPELVVLCDEIIENLKHYVRGVDVDDLDEMVEIITRTGPGGAYLTEKHTMKNFRTIHYPKFFSRKMKNPETSEVRAKIRESMHAILATHKVPALDEAILAELDAWTRTLEARPNSNPMSDAS